MLNAYIAPNLVKPIKIDFGGCVNLSGVGALGSTDFGKSCMSQLEVLSVRKCRRVDAKSLVRPLQLATRLEALHLGGGVSLSSFPLGEALANMRKLAKLNLQVCQ
jgi:hypothetical protein